MKIDIKFIRKVIEQEIPVHQFLGLQLLEIKRDYAKVFVPFKEELVGDVRRKRWHGGLISTVMDSVGGIVGMTHLTSLEDKLATIDMRVDYLKSVEKEGIVVEGRTVRLGNRILVTEMQAWNEDMNVLFAEGKGVYNFIRMKDKPLDQQ